MNDFNPFLKKIEQVFELEEGKLLAKLRINEMPNEEFAFFLSAHDQNEDLKTSVFGSAKLSDGDLESREDDLGNAYFVRELIFDQPEGKIRILTDLDHNHLSWVEIESGCEGFSGPLKLPEGKTFRVAGG